MSNGGKKGRRPSGDDGFPKITLPWLIIGIASMFMFMAFLISMYFEYKKYLFSAYRCADIMLAYYFSLYCMYNPEKSGLGVTEASVILPLLCQQLHQLKVL